MMHNKLLLFFIFFVILFIVCFVLKKQVEKFKTIVFTNGITNKIDTTRFNKLCIGKTCIDGELLSSVSPFIKNDEFEKLIDTIAEKEDALFGKEMDKDTLQETRKDIRKTAEKITGETLCYDNVCLFPEHLNMFDKPVDPKIPSDVTQPPLYNEDNPDNSLPFGNKYTRIPYSENFPYYRYIDKGFQLAMIDSTEEILKTSQPDNRTHRLNFRLVANPNSYDKNTETGTGKNVDGENISPLFERKRNGQNNFRDSSNDDSSIYDLRSAGSGHHYAVKQEKQLRSFSHRDPDNGRYDIEGVRETLKNKREKYLHNICKESCDKNKKCGGYKIMLTGWHMSHPGWIDSKYYWTLGSLANDTCIGYTKDNIEKLIDSGNGDNLYVKNSSKKNVDREQFIKSCKKECYKNPNCMGFIFKGPNSKNPDQEMMCESIFNVSNSSINSSFTDTPDNGDRYYYRKGTEFIGGYNHEEHRYNYYGASNLLTRISDLKTNENSKTHIEDLKRELAKKRLEKDKEDITSDKKYKIEQEISSLKTQINSAERSLADQKNKQNTETINLNLNETISKLDEMYNIDWNWHPALPYWKQYDDPRKWYQIDDKKDDKNRIWGKQYRFSTITDGGNKRTKMLSGRICYSPSPSSTYTARLFHKLKDDQKAKYDTNHLINSYNCYDSSDSYYNGKGKFVMGKPYDAITVKESSSSKNETNSNNKAAEDAAREADRRHQPYSTGPTHWSTTPQ